MLMNLHKQQWTQGLVMKRFEEHQTSNEKTVEVMTDSSLLSSKLARAPHGARLVEVIVSCFPCTRGSGLFQSQGMKGVSSWSGTPFLTSKETMPDMLDS